MRYQKNFNRISYQSTGPFICINKNFRFRSPLNRCKFPHGTMSGRTQFKSPRRLSSRFKFKERFPNLMCSNVIYKYKCSGCDATSYGETKRHLIIRCREHLGINTAGQKIKSNFSSIGDHISKSGYKASFDDFEIISKTDNHFDLLIHESLLIKQDTSSLNSQASSIPMVLF